MGKTRLLLTLFGVNAYTSSFSVGGGYVVIPMLRRMLVEKRRLVGEEELLDMAAVAQSSPGAIAINLSGLVGSRIAGFPGMAASCLGALLPPIVVLSLVSLVYEQFCGHPAVVAAFRGMMAGVVAIMADLVASMSGAVFRKRNLFASAIVPAAFAACFFLRINVGLVLACCAVAGLIAALASARKGDRDA